jgi:hypothetical protein
MANAVQNAPKFQLGKLSAEEAERLASSFRPAWELDDAPFAQGNGLSAADVDALTAGVGVSPSIRGATERQPAELKVEELKTEVRAPRVPAPHEPKVEVAVDIEIEPDPAPTPAIPLVAQAQPQQQAQVQPAPVQASAQPTVRVVKPFTPPRAPPPVVRMSDADASSDYAPVKKSNTGLILGVVGVLCLGGAIFGIKSLMSGNSTKASTAQTATTSSPTHEEAHIPPPPDPGTAGTSAPTQVAHTAQPVQTAPTQTAEKVVDPPPTTHTAPTTVHNAGGAAHPTGGGTHPAGGGGGTKPAGHIVRDNPF